MSKQSHDHQLIERLESVERIANIGTWEVNLVEGSITWSDQTKRIHEVDSDFIPTLEAGIEFYEQGRSRERIKKAVSDCIESGTPWDLELTLITAKSNRIWVRAKGEGVFSGNQCVRLFGVFQDITETRSTIERQRQLAQRLELVLRGTGLGLWDWNPQTNEVVFDERWCRMLGYELNEIVPNVQSWSSRVHPDDIDSCFEDIQSHINGESAFYSNVHRMRHKDGHWIYIHDRGCVVERDAEGNATRFTGTHEDVTAREVTNIRRKQLYAMTAHELRTPLSALEMMCETDQREDWWQHKDLFKHTVRNLFHTLDDMRMLMNPQVMRPVRVEAISLDEFNQSIVGLTTSVVTVNDFKLELISKDQPYIDANMFRFDSYRVRVALLNLIKNACLHSGGDRVTVYSEVSSADGEDEHLVWEVEDNGRGISDEMITVLFQPFARGDSAADGTGMGLYITKSWIEEIGGSLSYNRTDKGSKFRIELPVSRVKQRDNRSDGPAYTTEQIARVDGLRVLFVEDDLTLNMLGKRVLEKLGAVVDTARDGEEALSMLANEYDLVLTDYYMPKMTGLELIKNARNRSYTGPMVVLTAANLGDEQSKLHDAGADEVMIKPLSAQMFVDLIPRLRIPPYS